MGSWRARHELAAAASAEVNQEEASEVQNIGAPPRGQRKKLLILDLNGVLADIIKQDHHNRRLSDGEVGYKSVFKRPYCEGFLKFCIRNFKLAIWSSRSEANTDAVLNILMKDLKRQLLFCWHASQCTETGHCTIEKKNKPLVFKELENVWKLGEFSASNTLLVDDSPYKALPNPANTAIFPYSYKYKNKETDNSLAPRGDLRLYLEGLASADDVPSYVMEHPFGQLPITESSPDWEFYAPILKEMGINRGGSSLGVVR
ncbi:unnamed protein product [Urochloa humidicola]